MCWQCDDLLGSDRDRGLKIGGSRFGSDEQNNATATRQGPVRAASRGGHIEQHGRRGCPYFAARRIGRVDNRQPGGRCDAVHVVSDCGVADQRQDPVACGHDLSLRGATTQRHRR
jgi:hypothetical protein